MGMERVTIDVPVVDINLVDTSNHEKMSRPYVTTVVDESTGCIIGFHTSIEPSGLSSILKFIKPWNVNFY